MELGKRFGAALGAVAAFGRGHDHADAKTAARIGNPLVVGYDEHSRNPGHPSRCFDATLNQRFGCSACALQLDQWFSRVARRLVARRNQDLDVHRAGGQSWMWRTPTGLPSSTTNKVVILCSSNRVRASSTSESG